MMAIILAALAIAAFKAAQRLSILLVDVIATGIAAWYCWRSARVSRVLLAGRMASAPGDLASACTAERAKRRLIARHLRLSVAMTAHQSLFPQSTLRGRAMIKALAA